MPEMLLQTERALLLVVVAVAQWPRWESCAVMVLSAL